MAFPWMHCLPICFDATRKHNNHLTDALVWCFVYNQHLGSKYPAEIHSKLSGLIHNCPCDILHAQGEPMKLDSNEKIEKKNTDNAEARKNEKERKVKKQRGKTSGVNSELRAKRKKENGESGGLRKRFNAMQLQSRIYVKNWRTYQRNPIRRHMSRNLQLRTNQSSSQRRGDITTSFSSSSSSLKSCALSIESVGYSTFKS